MALTVAGVLLAFGQNTYGALGTGDEFNRFKPTKINMSLHDRSKTHCRRVVQVVCGAKHTVALVSNSGRMQVNTTGQWEIVCRCLKATLLLCVERLVVILDLCKWQGCALLISGDLSV